MENTTIKVKHLMVNDVIMTSWAEYRNCECPNEASATVYNYFNPYEDVGDCDLYSSGRRICLVKSIQKSPSDNCKIIELETFGFEPETFALIASDEDEAYKPDYETLFKKFLSLFEDIPHSQIYNQMFDDGIKGKYSHDFVREMYHMAELKRHQKA